MAVRLDRLPLPAAFGVRADGTTWISLGDPPKPPHMQFDGPLCAKAAAEIVRSINAAPVCLDALKAVLTSLRDPDANNVLPNAVAEKVVAALAAMGERS
ncbi:hypothetical protein ACSD7O_25030 [Methylorubrum extorquens]|uniref:hypothetical protein n=1 Tax=Methylorubrum extorquens TaxID=408 RepID=UPI003F63E3CE